MHTYFLLLIFLLANPSLNFSKNKGSLSFHEMPSPMLKRNLEYMVYTPPNYNSNKKYPIVYFLNGMTLLPRYWETFGSVSHSLDRLIAQKKLPPVIAVFPRGDALWYVDSANVPIYSAFKKEFFPYIEKKYNIIQKRESRAIGGLSMGGHGTLRFIFDMPEYFGSAFAISPAVTPKGVYPAKILNFLMKSRKVTCVYGYPIKQELWDEYSYHTLLEKYLKSPHRVNLFITSGTIDIVTPIQHIDSVIADFKSKNVPFIYQRVRNKDHSWIFWKPATFQSLSYIGTHLKSE